MKKKSLFKLLVIVVFFAGAVGAGYYSLLFHQLTKEKPVNAIPDKLFGWKFPVAKFPSTGSGRQIAYSSIRDPGGIPQGLPVRLKIPVIGVDSAIEDALITPDGRMDVPVGSVNVAWFSLGPHPGQVGSAVIGGHFGINNGIPFVFYNLDKLKGGDKVYIVNDKGDTLAFVVRSIKSFDRNADATTVFTSQDGLAHLNLITCEGTWNQINGSYPSRLVIFTDAIPAESIVMVKTQSSIIGKPILPAITTPIATPTVTPMPTTSPTPSMTSVPTATETISTPSGEKSLPLPFMLIASAKSLYTTPLDGLITSFLLLSIVFIVFKIIKR